MEADYSIELGPAAPALEIPWSDPDERLHYLDLRRQPDSIADIPEAQQFPALRHFLIEANSPLSAWQTAKCDVWTDETEAAENLYDAGFEQSCYVDLVLAEQAAPLRECLELHQLVAKEMAHMLAENEVLEAFAEITVRRCYFHSQRRCGRVHCRILPDTLPHQLRSDSCSGCGVLGSSDGICR